VLSTKALSEAIAMGNIKVQVDDARVLTTSCASGAESGGRDFCNAWPNVTVTTNAKDAFNICELMPLEVLRNDTIAEY
jgi:hypothetical protein